MRHFLHNRINSVVSSIDPESRNTLQHLLIATSMIPKRRDCFIELLQNNPHTGQLFLHAGMCYHSHNAHRDIAYKHVVYQW